MLRNLFYSTGPVGLPLGAGEPLVWIWSPVGETGPYLWIGHSGYHPV